MPPQKRYLENDTRPKNDKKVFPVPCYGVIVASFEPYLGFVSPWRMMRLWNTPNFRLGTKCRGPSLGVVGNSLGLVVLFDHLGFFPPLKELGWVGLQHKLRLSKKPSFKAPWLTRDIRFLILHGIAQTQVLVDQTRLHFPVQVPRSISYSSKVPGVRE